VHYEWLQTHYHDKNYFLIDIKAPTFYWSQ